MAKNQPSDKETRVPGKDGEQPSKTMPRQGRPDSKSSRQDNRASKGDGRPNPVSRFIKYVEASRAELRKVTWPTARETRKATLAVLGFVGIMAIILGLIDLGLSSLIKAILS